VAVIIDLAAPTKVSELRSFLDLGNYYQSFIKGYLKLVAPLSDLLKKDQRWDWNDQCEAAFQQLKEVIATKPVLALPDFNQPFEAHTDALGRAISVVLV
jgi:hypothetical protein